jgi:hypothetical protein
MMSRVAFSRAVVVAQAIAISLLPVVAAPAAAAASVSISVDGSQKFQTMTSLGVDINANSWDGGNLTPALDMLVDQNGSQTFRVVIDMTDWEARNDDSDPNTFNWNYYDPIYSGQVSFDTQYAGSNFANLWHTIDYLHAKGIPDSQIMLSFMGPGPSWMGGASLDATHEDEWVEEVLSAAYYGYTHGHTFGLFSPDNEEDISHNEGVTMSSTLYADAMNRLAGRMNALGMDHVMLVGPETCCSFDPTPMMSYPTLMGKLAHFDLHDYTGSTQGAAAQIAGSGKDFWMSEYNQFDQSFNLLGQGAAGLMVWEAYDSVFNHAVLNDLGSAPGNDSYGNTALIGYDKNTKTYTPRNSFYQFAQLFRFVPIGAVRVAASSDDTAVHAVAFLDPASSRFTLVGENTSPSSQTIGVSLKNLMSPPSTVTYYQTNSNDDMARGSDVAVSGGVALVTVPGGTVFTLTGLGALDTAPPPAPPAAPANLTATGGVSSVSLHWTTPADSGGVTQYNVYRSSTPGLTPSSSNKIGQSTTTSYTDEGLAAGDYFYVVTAQDAAGNISDASNEASAVVTADTQPPTVSITSPTGATVSGTTSLTASATDDVGVAGVQFQLDDANLGPELTAEPYTYSWDTTATSNGPHVLVAFARDAAGNTISSSPVAVTVSNAANTLLLGAATVQGLADSNPTGDAEAFTYVAAASGSARTLSFYVDSGSAATTLEVGVYADSGGRPGTLLTSGTISSPKSAAWNTAILSSNPTLSAGTRYWIGLLGTGGQLNYRDGATGSCSQSNSASGLTSLPPTWSTGIAWPTCDLSAYVSSVSVTAGASVPVA